MKKLKERQAISLNGMFYSIQRIDLLIISICGAGIYLCLETMKYLSDKTEDIHILIRISGGLFLLGIIINFFSQFFGYKTHEQDYLMCEVEINAGKKINKKEEMQIEKYDSKSDMFSKLTNIFNYSSALLMFIALINIMCFFLFIF